jgi:hypothetical protein
VIEKDVVIGRRYFDLGAGLYPSPGGPATEPTLAKIEWTVQGGRMPPFRYKIAHWESSLGANDLGTLMSWVHSTRKQHYAPEGLAEAVAAKPVHPLSAAARRTNADGVIRAPARSARARAPKWRRPSLR